MQAISNALRGHESENSQEALRVLDIILRQHVAKQGYLLVRQSFFHNNLRNFVVIGGGVLGCRGLHSSFRTSQGGLSLNIGIPLRVWTNGVSSFVLPSSLSTLSSLTFFVKIGISLRA